VSATVPKKDQPCMTVNAPIPIKIRMKMPTTIPAADPSHQPTLVFFYGWIHRLVALPSRTKGVLHSFYDLRNLVVAPGIGDKPPL
jgi:hypothetical protein